MPMVAARHAWNSLSQAGICKKAVTRVTRYNKIKMAMPAIAAAAFLFFFIGRPFCYSLLLQYKYSMEKKGLAMEAERSILKFPADEKNTCTFFLV